MESMRVVCISNGWIRVGNHSNPAPIKGEIYTVDDVKTIDGHIAYHLIEIPRWSAYYGAKGFRPVDDIFGPSVCERIEEQIEYEKAIEV